MHLASTVHVRTSLLMDSMPMDSSRLISKHVIHMHNNSIAHGCSKFGARPYPIDRNDGPLEAVGGGINPSDVPCLLDSLCDSERDGQQMNNKRPHNGKKKNVRVGMKEEDLLKSE